MTNKPLDPCHGERPICGSPECRECVEFAMESAGVPKLDPCPVCGGPVLLFGDGTVEHGIAGLTAEQIVDLCCYGNKHADHRRLCAEVALARYVIDSELLDWFRSAIVDNATAERWNGLSDAIARVREASK